MFSRRASQRLEKHRQISLRTHREPARGNSFIAIATFPGFDHHSRRLRPSAQHASRCPRTHQQRLVPFERAQCRNRRAKALRAAPARACACSLSVASSRARLPFSHIRIGAIHQHAQGPFLLPAFTRKSRAPRSTHIRPRARPACAPILHPAILSGVILAQAIGSAPRRAEPFRARTCPSSAIASSCLVL